MKSNRHYLQIICSRAVPFLSVCLIVFFTACSTTGNGGSSSSKSVQVGFYRVQKGDTLSTISRRYRKSLSNLVRWNNLSDPSKIEVGQVLRLQPPAGGNSKLSSGGKKPSSSSTKPSISNKTTPNPVYRISLQWPATGKIIQGYNLALNKGINIAGSMGDPVRAAAAGKVAYSGDGLRQYGNMIIIKHDSDYLTVYAHNHSLKVKDGDTVKAGQVIASMGDKGSSSGVMLHFELRYQGNTINPTPYLPPR